MNHKENNIFDFFSGKYLNTQSCDKLLQVECLKRSRDFNALNKQRVFIIGKLNFFHPRRARISRPSAQIKLAKGTAKRIKF